MPDYRNENKPASTEMRTPLPTLAGLDSETREKIIAELLALPVVGLVPPSPGDMLTEIGRLEYTKRFAMHGLIKSIERAITPEK